MRPNQAIIRYGPATIQSADSTTIIVGSRNRFSTTVSQKQSLTDDVAEFEIFLEMAREFPVRTGIFTFGLPVFAALQAVNTLFSDGSTAIVAGFGALMVVFSIGLTRYHVAAFRREKIEQRIF